MKPSILSFAFSTLLGLSVAASGVSNANESIAERGKDPIKMIFSGLDLSQEQKQDIREILRQSKQDNAVYQGERQALRAQMKSLMELSSWDQALATDLATQRITLSAPSALNKAKAQNAAFNLLSAEQQSAFIAKQAKRAEGKMRREGLNFERMQNKLELSDEQVQSLEQIQQAHLESTAASKVSMKAHKEAQQALIQAANFDESAWSALQTQIQPTRIALDVARMETRFEMMQLLNEKQQAQLARIMKKHDQKGKGKRQAKDKRPKQAELTS